MQGPLRHLAPDGPSPDIQAQKLLFLFEEAHGHGAKTAEELAAWIVTPEGRAAMWDVGIISEPLSEESEDNP